MSRGWPDVAGSFRDTFNPCQGTTGRWEQAELAYRYGWEAAGLPAFAGRPWSDAAPELERAWPAYQRMHGRTVVADWEGYRKAVQQAYEATAAATTTAPATPASDPVAQVRAVLEAYNSKGKASLDTIVGCMAPDAEISFSPANGPIKGEKQIRAAFTGVFADEAGTQIIIHNIVNGGAGSVAAEWSERGRNYRTGEDIARQVAGIFEISGGKITRARMYPVRLR